MAIAALVIAIVALLVAGASAWYTRRQTLAAERQTALDAERSHREREPDVRLVVDGFSLSHGGPPATLIAKNVSEVDLDSVTIEIVPVVGEGIGPVTAFLPSAEQSIDLGRMKCGDVHKLQVDSEPNALGWIAHFRVTCRAGEESWRLARSSTVLTNSNG